MFDPTNYNELTVTESSIPGLFVIKLPVHGDNRGWFKENYQKEKMEALGLPRLISYKTISASMTKLAHSWTSC